jgi:transcriptional regulator with GAF, ATPase, and Fis domain/streptogramin lyase
VGTYGGGLNKFDRQTGRFYHYQNSPNNPNSISGNAIRFIFEDRSGVLWIGTWLNGLNKLDAFSNKFTLYQHNARDKNSLNNNRVWALEEDREGNLWIGTDGGGLNMLDRKTGRLSAYVHDPDSPHSLSNNSVGIVYEDPSGILWVGTYGGGLNRFDRPNGRFIRYMHNPDDPNSLSSNMVQSVLKDSKGNLWIGSLNSGLNKLNLETGIFTRYLPDESTPGCISSSRVNSIFEDSFENLWIGTDGRGLNKYNREGDNFTQFYDPEKGFEIILNIYEDSSGRFWVGTYSGGLHLFDRTTGTSVAFTEKDGLPHNGIKGIVEDAAGNLWLGTERGLSKFNYENRSFRNYDVADGLQGSHFNYHAAGKGEDGMLFFGGINGFNCFYPDRLEDNRFPPQVVLTNFKIFNQSVSVSEDTPLKRHINIAEEIILPYWQNDFSIGYAALHFSCPAKNSYAFKMENYEDEWRQVGHQRSATYTNLDPGEYVFRVKGANGDGVWNPEGASIRIIIHPPFWKTWWFRALAILSVLIAAFVVYQRRIKQIEVKKKALEIRVKEKTEAAEALQNALSEVEQLKNRLQAENVYLQDEIKLVHNFERIITRSQNFKKLLRSVEQVASTEATVLILGESGTGKELLARAIHNISPRGDRPLVKVNCAALPTNLIESELFGHEKGAFTGAIARKIGRFELADGGTIFLDEIGDLPLELQAKLLRVLQEGEFERLGNSQTIKVDVRILAATNRDLESEVEKGNFREDLFYRLNVFPVKIPPLRDRKEDIHLLVKHFIQKHARKIGREVNAVPQYVLETLQQYHWPGNVRELENVIERAMIISKGNKLLLGDWVPQNNGSSNGKAHFLTLEESEKHHILEALEKTGWRVSGEKGAAKILGLNPKTLESRIKKLNIHRGV